MAAESVPRHLVGACGFCDFQSTLDCILENRMCALCINLNHHRSFLPSIAEMLRSLTATRPQATATILEPLVVIPAAIVGIRIPDSDVSVAAMSLAQSAASPVLFNHSLRTFVLGMIDARTRALKVDEEACFVSSILHDLALLPQHSGNLMKSFEENGAEIARTFSLKHGFSADRAEIVAKAILLHAGQARGMGADIEFVMVGAGLDVFGPSPEQLSDDQISAVERDVPRLIFKTKFLSLLNDHVSRTNKPTWTTAFVKEPPPQFLMNRWSE